MKVVITEAAENDLSALRHWIREDNPVRADSFLEELEERIFSLEERPYLYAVAFETSRGAIRRMVHRGYRILYTVRKDVVEVLVVHHGSRDSEKFLQSSCDR